MIGFSIFLQDEWTAEKDAYVTKMAEAGFSGVFTSLHIPEDDASTYKQRLQPLMKAVKKHNLKLVADISGNVLEEIGLSVDYPQSINESGFTGLRMDYGIDNQTIARLSHDTTVALNASTLTEMDYEELVANNANFSNLEAWHNYYPHPETGLDENWFYQCNVWLKNKGFRICAFAPGNSHLRLPLFATLPTLEVDRYQHPLASVLSLQQHYLIDDVYIGDPGLMAKTIEQFQSYIRNNILCLYAESTERKWNSYLFGNHQNRLDVARDVIRSEQSRILNGHNKIDPENTIERAKGSITLDNALYKRYKGELQIAKRQLPANRKVNVIGQVMQEDLVLIDFISSGTAFELRSPRRMQQWT